MEDYRKMWEELGVNLDLHDQLMTDTDKLFEKSFLSQKNRPKTMERFDKSFHACHAGRVAEIREYRKNGGKSIGTFCIYVPDEIAFAAKVLPIPWWVSSRRVCARRMGHSCMWAAKAGPKALKPAKLPT